MRQMYNFNQWLLIVVIKHSQMVGQCDLEDKRKEGGYLAILQWHK